MKTWSQNRQRRQIVAAAAILSLLVMVVVAALAWRSGAGIPLPIPRPAPDPWSVAIKQARDTLTEAPDFEAHMQSYRSLPSEIDDYISKVERARLALAIGDELRKAQIPLLGNAWQVLTSTLNIVPGAGAMLDNLDETLRQVLSMKGALTTLRDADAVAVAAQQFRANPSRRNVVVLRDRCAFYGRLLSTSDADVQAQLVVVNTALQRVDSIEQGFLRIEDVLARLRPVANSVAALRQAISDLFDPLRRLSTALDRLHARMQTELATMETIQRIVAAAEQPAANK